MENGQIRKYLCEYYASITNINLNSVVSMAYD